MLWHSLGLEWRSDVCYFRMARGTEVIRGCGSGHISVSLGGFEHVRLKSCGAMTPVREAYKCTVSNTACGVTPRQPPPVNTPGGRAQW